MSNESEPLLSYADAAQLLNISAVTVRRLCVDGKLQRVMVGGSPRIRPADLRSYVDRAADRRTTC